jgi:hypothetical protein
MKTKTTSVELKMRRMVGTIQIRQSFEKPFGLIRQVVPNPEISPQSRKAKRSRDKLAKATPQLRFITTTNPEQDKDHRTRKIVRSHVARQYHVVRQQAWKDDEELQGKNQSQSRTPNAENAGEIR